MKGKYNNMNMFKKLIAVASLAIIGLVNSVQADTATLTLTGVNTNNLIFAGPALLRSISIQSTAGTNGLLNFYDSPYGTNTLTIAVSTNLTRTVATTNIIYTNIFGVISTNSYSVIRVTTNTVSAANKVRELVYSYTTASNATEAVEFEVNKYLAGGLLVTNISTLGGAPGGGVIINVEYEKLR
jgi:hypothetical protein